MSKGLEALKEFKNQQQGVNVYANEYLDIIEKELKEYEMEHTLRVRLENINYELVREKQENEKKLKALEIIKKKRVDILGVLLYAFERENGCDFYNSYMIKEEHKLTQEEYDLLKEVLL